MNVKKALLYLSFCPLLILVSCKKSEISSNSELTEISFEKHISPIAIEKCIDCHSSSTEISLNTKENWVDLSEEGRLNSILIENNHFYFGSNLTQLEKDIIQDWIANEYPD
jgi:hypothetical protein